MSNKKTNIIIYFITIIFSIAFIVIGYNSNKVDLTGENYTHSYKAEIISINDISTLDLGYEYGDLSSTTITASAKIKNKDLKDEIVEIYQYLDDVVAVNPKQIDIGDKVIIASLFSRTGEGTDWTFMEYDRSNILIGLVLSFFILIILFCRKKGVNTLISLILTCLSIFMVFIPAILKGKNIYISSIVVSIFIIIMNLLIIHGWNKKTICSLLGNFGGLFVAGILSYIISNILNLTGLIDDDSMFLLMINPSSPINLKAILWGSIVIGSLGAVMDISMSIASAMHEFSENVTNIDFKSILKSGLNIGQDAVGTMTNTLILAYIGSSLSAVLLFVVNYKDMLLLFNIEMIVFEIIQAIIGSMGILFTIPITSLAAAYMYSKNKK